MNQAYNDEFFINQSSTIPVSLNYYFEIPSIWARGNKEMLTISIITNEQITPVLQELFQQLCIDFAIQLKSDENTFKGIYHNQMEKFSERFDRRGQLALITGSRRGIGLGIALALSEAGFNIVLNAVSQPESAEEAVEKIRKKG